jgi:hypothetical protein
LPGQDVDGEEKWDGKLPENEVQEDGVRMPDKTIDAPNQDGTSPASGEIEDDTTLILNFQNSCEPQPSSLIWIYLERQ